MSRIYESMLGTLVPGYWAWKAREEAKAEKEAIRRAGGPGSQSLVPVAGQVKAPGVGATFTVVTSDSQKSVRATDLVGSTTLGKPQTPGFDASKGEGNLTENGWVYACLHLICKAVSSVPYIVERLEGDVWVPAPSHPMQTLLDRPNPYVSRTSSYYALAQQLYLSGNGCLAVVRAGGAPRELWTLRSDHVRPIPVAGGFIGSYEVGTGSNKREVKSKDLVHWMLPNPTNPFWGLSPLEPAQTPVQTDTASAEWNRHAMANRTVSDGALVTDKALSQRSYDELQGQVAAQHQGPENARKWWLLHSGLKWVPMDKSPVEMDFIAGRRLTREEICAILGVPPVMVGVYDKATLSNFETGRLLFWEDTVVPLLLELGDLFTFRLAPEFEGKDGVRVRARPDLKRVPALWQAFERRLNAAGVAKGLGLPMTEINERLALGFDLTDMDEGETNDDT